MKRGKLSAFRIALRDAYKKVNEDRDLAEKCLASTESIIEKYDLLAKLCETVGEGIQEIYDQIIGLPELKTKMKEVRSSMTYLTVQHLKDTKEYLPEYNVYKGNAFEGFVGLFKYINHDNRIHLNIIKEKIEKKDYTGAIIQYKAMKNTCTKTCDLAGIIRPAFIGDDILDKYNKD